MKKLTERQFKKAKKFRKTKASVAFIAREFGVTDYEVKKSLKCIDYDQYINPVVKLGRPLSKLAKLLDAEPAPKPIGWKFERFTENSAIQTGLPFPSTIEDVMRELTLMHNDLLNKLDQLSAQK